MPRGKIASLDDTVAKYVPKLAGNPYGETSIRNVLRMSSGVPFREVYDGKDDLTKFARSRVTRTVRSRHCAMFTDREAEQGTRFHYASIETVVLAVLLRAVTGTTLSEYLTPRLWQPMGAEADASWIKSSDGLETGSGSFNATLRDYGRLGMLLANDGAVGGKQIVPKDYLLEATDWHRHPAAFAPRRATPFFGYGYQFWTFPARSDGLPARCLRPVDLRRSRTQARDGDHGRRQERQRRKRVFWRGTQRGLARRGRQIRQLVALLYRFFVPDRGMHLRVRTTPVAVICAPTLP